KSARDEIAAVEQALKDVLASAQFLPVNPVSDAIDAEAGVPVCLNESGCKIDGIALSRSGRLAVHDDGRCRGSQSDQAGGIGVEPQLHICVVVMETMQIVVVCCDIQSL